MLFIELLSIELENVKGNTRNQYSDGPIPKKCLWRMEVGINQSQKHIHWINDFDLVGFNRQAIQFNHKTGLKWFWISWNLKYLPTTASLPTELSTQIDVCVVVWLLADAFSHWQVHLYIFTFGWMYKIYSAKHWPWKTKGTGPRIKESSSKYPVSWFYLNIERREPAESLDADLKSLNDEVKQKADEGNNIYDCT